MDSERALAVAEESFLVNLLSDETQEIIRHDMREYEIEMAAVLKEMKRENIYGCRDLFQN